MSDAPQPIQEKCPGQMSGGKHFWSIASGGTQECLWCHATKPADESQRPVTMADLDRFAGLLQQQISVRAAVAHAQSLKIQGRTEVATMTAMFASMEGVSQAVAAALGLFKKGVDPKASLDKGKKRGWIPFLKKS